MPRINLLPWRETERKRKQKEFYITSFAAIGLALFGAVLIRGYYGHVIENQKARNQYLTEQMKQIDGQIQEIKDQEGKKQSLQSRIKVIEELQRSRSEVVHIMDQFVRLLPEGVYLTEVKQTERRIQIKGIAESSSLVSAFMRNIDSSEWLKEPSLEIVETKDAMNTGSSFTMYAQQKSAEEQSEEKKVSEATNSQVTDQTKEDE